MSITSDLSPKVLRENSRLGVWGGRLTSPGFPWLAILVPTLVLALHAAMLPQGQWHDEFFTFSYLHLFGAKGVLLRMTEWGPRPFSVLLIFIYWELVQATGSPLMAPVLAFSWAMLFAFLLAAAEPWRSPAQSGRWMLALTLPALFLLAGAVRDLWYWPLGALAYLPALGAASYATLVLAGPGLQVCADGRPRGAWALAAALTLGALSVELGTFLALLLCPLLVADTVWRSGRGGFHLALPLALPFAAAGAVGFGLLHGRVAQNVEMLMPGTTHHAWLSLRAAVPHMAAELAGSADDVWGGSGWQTGGWDMARCLAGRLALLAGSWAVFRAAWPVPVQRGPLVMLVLALGGTALLSIAGAYYQFGLLCCERHDTYRQSLYLLAAVALGATLPRAAARHPALPRGALARVMGWAGALTAKLPGRGLFDAALLGPALLAFAILIEAPPRLRALVTEYRLAAAEEASTAAMFRSGNAPGDAPLALTLAPAGPLLGGSNIVPGSYSMSDNPPWYVQGPMLYFRKSRMVVRAAQ